MEETKQIHPEVKSPNIFSVSLENDNLVVNLSSSPLQPIGLEQPEYWKESISLELFENMEGQEENDIYQWDEKDDVFLDLCESIGLERTDCKGSPKFRESLGWDRAFFTDAGVLDPEELSSMIKGTENGEKHILFGIDEDVELSTDSISAALGSVDLNLVQPTAEFFEDDRDSNQISSKMSNLTISSNQSASPKAVNEDISALKEVDCTKNMPMPKAVSKRTIRAHISGMSRSQQKQIGGMQGLGKAVTEINSQVAQMKANTRTKDSKSLLTPPKRSSKASCVSAAIEKGTSMDSKHVKMDHVNAKLSTAAGKGTQAPKVVASKHARNVLLKPVLSLNPPSTGFSTSAMMASRSSSDSAASPSSDKTGKCTSSAARRKVESKHVGRPSSGSIMQTPSKIALKNDVSSTNSAVGAYVMSSKMSPRISPGSSVSEWSSASSSSSSIKKRSNGSRTSLDTCRSKDSNSSTMDLTNSSSRRHTSDKSVPRTAVPNENTSKPLRKNTVSQAASKKPSFLRLPSPKIGGVKSVCSPSGSMQSPSNPSVTKLGASIRRNAKTKTADVPPAKTLNVAVRAECDTEEAPSQISLQDKLPASVDTRVSPGDVEYYPSLTMRPS